MISLSFSIWEILQMQSITAFSESVNQLIGQTCHQVSRFLDKHPVVYKIVLVACHLFRAAGMYGLMMVSPLPFPLTCAVAVAGSLLYRASVERFCCFRFALPSCVGAGAYWISKVPMIQLVSGAAFASVTSTVLSLAGALPLLGYVGYVSYISHEEYEANMGKPKGHCGSCVGGSG